jgi:hypothetical protein
MKYFWGLIFWPALIVGCNEMEPCGDYPGEVSFQEMFGTDTETCYTSVGGDLTINITDGFTEVEMPYVTSLGGDLRILCNYDLVRLDLGSLVYIRGDVEIEGNKSLPNLDGLRSLKYVGGSLTIGGQSCKHPNGELVNIEGLDKLESVGGNIKIEGNPRLPTCAAEALVQRLKYFPGIAAIDGNNTNATCE